MDKLALIKIKLFCSSKDTVRKQKVMYQEKTHANDTSEKNQTCFHNISGTLKGQSENK